VSPVVLNAQRELVGVRDVAVMLGVSRATARRWNDEGLLPSPLRVGGRILWRVRELRDWIDAGGPPRDDWKWRPSLPAKLEQLIELKRDEAVALAAEIAELEERRRQGDIAASVVVRRVN